VYSTLLLRTNFCPPVTYPLCSNILRLDRACGRPATPDSNHPPYTHTTSKALSLVPAFLATASEPSVLYWRDPSVYLYGAQKWTVTRAKAFHANAKVFRVEIVGCGLRGSNQRLARFARGHHKPRKGAPCNKTHESDCNSHDAAVISLVCPCAQRSRPGRVHSGEASQRQVRGSLGKSQIVQLEQHDARLGASLLPA
jgi:hypothetical protein